MPKFHFTYTGENQMPESDDEQAAVMQEWERWFGQLGAAVVDGGHPFGASQTITSDGSVSDGATANGYSIVNAADLSDAVSKAKDCPVLASGGNVEVSECLAM